MWMCMLDLKLTLHSAIVTVNYLHQGKRNALMCESVVTGFRVLGAMNLEGVKTFRILGLRWFERQLCNYLKQLAIVMKFKNVYIHINFRNLNIRKVNCFYSVKCMFTNNIPSQPMPQ